MKKQKNVIKVNVRQPKKYEEIVVPVTVYESKEQKPYIVKVITGTSRKG